jgi:hypothetical protein
VVKGAPAIIYPVPTRAPAVVGTSSLEVLVWTSMNVILTDRIRVAPSAPVPIQSGPTRVLVKAGSDLVEVHAWISTSAIHLY